MRNYGHLSIGRDQRDRSFVINYTRDYFSLGMTAAAPTVIFVGLSASAEASKRQDQQDGSAHKRFRGLLLQAWLIWAKLYLCLYFDGDGPR